MLKTIKTTKQMRLDELIKYIWDNGIKSKQELITYKSNSNTVLTIDISGQIAVYGAHFGNEIFTVEDEVPIDENTRFSFLFEIDEDNFVHTVEDITISEMICSDTERIYAPLNCKLELVWERDEE